MLRRLPAEEAEEYGENPVRFAVKSKKVCFTHVRFVAGKLGLLVRAVSQYGCNFVRFDDDNTAKYAAWRQQVEGGAVEQYMKCFRCFIMNAECIMVRWSPIVVF